MARITKRFEEVASNMNCLLLYEPPSLGRWRQADIRADSQRGEPVAKWSYARRGLGCRITVCSDKIELGFEVDGNFVYQRAFGLDEKKAAASAVHRYLFEGGLPPDNKRGQN